MYTKLARLSPVLMVLFFAVSPHVDAASISAITQVCSGFYGSASAPQLACGSGDAGGGGGVIVGGSGVGSGINIPFSVNAYGGELSATAEALQDYGIFHGYAAIHKRDPYANTFGGVYRARAAGEVLDTWTFTNGVGTGLVNFAFTIDGGGSATFSIVDGQGDESAQADLAILLYMSPANKPNQSATLCCVTSPGTYMLTPGIGNGIRFTYGEPLNVQLLTIVTAGGGYDRLNPPSFYELDAVAAFAHTAILSGIFVTDELGNAVTDFELTAASGTRYPLSANQPVPLPPAFGLLLIGLGIVRWIGLRLRVK